MKKKILFVYTKMVIGGSTTSLISILENINYDFYKVDLLLLDPNGDLQDAIPKEVNTIILESTLDFNNKLKKLFSISFLYNHIYSLFLSKIYSNKLIMHQIKSKYKAKKSNKLKKTYDVAIAFLEFWPTYYVANRVSAKKKIAWLHIDYLGARLLPRLDYYVYNKYEKIVTVSSKCSINLTSAFPMFKDKIIIVRNILSQKTIQNLSKKQNLQIDTSSLIKLVTVCRISFNHKGLDRGVEALAKLNSEKGISEKYVWYIIGDGPDYSKLEQLISKYKLNNNIKLLGSKLNPHVYVKYMDIFFLPSHYEGMPMAVTEAQMLGVVPCVTRYASAENQINNNFDGIIIDNNNESIYNFLRNVFEGEININVLKENITSRNYSNLEEMDKIYRLIDD